MKQLAELVQLLGPDYKLCTCNYKNDDALRALFTYFQETEMPEAEEAARRLNLDLTDASFRKLKHQLKLQLINALTEIRAAGRSDDRRKRTYAYVWKLITIGKQLRTSVGSAVLLPYLQDAFRMAEAEELLDAAFTCATMLRRQYVNRQFDKEKYLTYRDAAATYRELSRCYQDVVAEFNAIVYLRNTRQPAAEISAAARAAFDRFEHAIAGYDVALISYIVFLLELNIYLVIHDYESVIRVADKALRYLREKPAAQSTMFQVFEANLTVAYTQLNDYERGTAFARSLLEKTLPTDFNYLKVYELLLVLSLRAGRFQDAYETYRSIQPEMLTRNLLSYYSETFRLIEAYLYLLVGLGQIKTHSDDRTFQRFRISRFLNSFEYAQHEKSQRNVHLLIVEIVDHIIHRRHHKTTYSIEAITKYANRHLKGREYERVRYFLKALAQLSTQQFHRAAVERHTTRYITLMQKKSIAESRLDYFMELIPYETLWALILDQLGYKRIRLRQTGKKPGK